MTLFDEQNALRYIRAQRHVTANHLQLISGWLELGRLDSALAALNELNQRLAAEAQLMSFLPEPLAALLVARSLVSEDRGFNLCFMIENPLPVAIPYDLEWPMLRRTLLDGWQAVERAAATAAGERIIEVGLYGIRLSIGLPGVEQPRVTVTLARELAAGS